MFADAQFSTPSGKAQFIAPANSFEVLNHHEVNSLHRKPLTLLLNSGRSRDQWHTMTRTGHIASLRANVPEPALSLHSSLLKPFKLVAGDLVQIQSATGSSFRFRFVTRPSVNGGKECPDLIQGRKGMYLEQKQNIQR